MTLVGGVNMDPAPGGAHTSMGMLLTNTIPNDERLGQGISVDQVIAREIGNDTPFSSVHLGNVTQGGGSASVYYRGASDAIAAEDSPYRSFDRLFGNVEGGGTNPATIAFNQRRSSIIDGVLDDLNRFRGTLPNDDQQLIDLHLDSLRNLEKELSADVAECFKPDVSGNLDTDSASNLPAISELNHKIAAAAFNCGLTRVIGMPYLRPVRDHRLTFLGQTEGLHTISHNAVPDSEEKYITIQTWYAEQLNSLCQRLAAIPEAGGTVLDNTLVVHSNPLSLVHGKTNLPLLMIGGDWYFNSGQYQKMNNEPIGKWLVSLCHAMGLNNNTFGRTETSNGPLLGLTL